ncbi:hypothetical protein N8I74_12035 [Chitiniphilus purpureus]|uniref:Transposase n=1 Tax=Chitiniphilus purpureus TaxID=2981137 RepID=A0ABY6DKR6_9NEIS|nr:hypothetical protein [Chitiniphilus sp. CD1]UXY14051.1 hypothetical protein N8I74_12035 [Chitiniphilus sp. CD1]
MSAQPERTRWLGGDFKACILPHDVGLRAPLLRRQKQPEHKQALILQIATRLL